jgi:type VI secretion system protein ImpK
MADNDDPFSRQDATKLRPRPGAGKRGWNEPAAASRAATRVDPIPEAAREMLGVGLNPLVQAASPLLLLGGQLRSTLTQLDVAGLRRHVVDEIRRFEENARRAGVRNEVVLTARYVLCALLDEAVLATPWGAQSDWSQHTLLIAMHREAWGGEKFFEMLDRISADPNRHIDLMELQYLALAFGFTGKYQVLDRGHERLADVQRGLYRKIRDFRGNPEADLSLRWRGLEDRRNPLVRYVPWWVITAAALAIVAIAFTAYYAWIAGVAAPVHEELAKVGLEDFSPPEVPPPAPRGPTLKQLLAPEEQAGTMTVEEQPGRTLVTLVSRNLFASGSAQVNPAYVDTLQRLANALNRVPGRVLVEGHTDNQRLKSLQYQDNFELSRERAVSVVKILQQTVDKRTQMQWTGAGESRPRYRPEGEPENQARNRRVEIIHMTGS